MDMVVAIFSSAKGLMATCRGATGAAMPDDATKQSVSNSTLRNDLISYSPVNS
jgi:hypothetical protein